MVNILSANLKIAQKVFIPLYLLVVISAFFEQLLTTQMQKQLHSQNGPGWPLYLAGFASLLLSLALPVLQSLVAAQGLSSVFNKRVNFAAVDTEKIKFLIIELMRSWGQILWGSIFLLIPGLIRYCQLIFVPWVVLFSRNYEIGKVDALKDSTKIFKKKWPTVLLLLFVFQLFLPLVMTGLFDSARLFSNSLFSALLLAAVDTVWILFFIQFLFLIFYKEKLEEMSDESVLSVERY